MMINTKDRARYKRNTQGRDFVCGDLHGSYQRLIEFMDFVGFDKDKDRMFSVGDLVDRGPDSEKCLRLIKEIWFHAVIGNHEQLMSMYYGTNGSASCILGSIWARNGGRWGVSYGDLNDPDYASVIGQEIRELSRQATNLPLMITVERQDGKHFHVIHAELRSDRALSDEDLDDQETFDRVTKVHNEDGEFITWGRHIYDPIRKIDLNRPNEFRAAVRRIKLEKPDVLFGPNLSHIYSGHSIMRQPTRCKGQTNLDTMAFKSFSGVEQWAGLTVTEPLTDRFWLTNADGVKETKPIILS